MDAAVLDDQARDAFWRVQCEPKAELGAVVVQPDDVVIQVECVDERPQEGGVRVEGVTEVLG
jgi:hypothetical protein